MREATLNPPREETPVVPRRAFWPWLLLATAAILVGCALLVVKPKEPEAANLWPLVRRLESLEMKLDQLERRN